MNKLLKLSTLVKLKGNPRTIKDSSFDKLCTSIKDNPEYFNARPIIVSTRKGKNEIIAGNQRYEAAKKLKIKEVPCYVMEGLTEDKEREIIIRDNVSNGDWDMELLANDWNLDDLLAWGLELPELAVAEDVEVEEVEADSAEDMKTDVVLGDLIEIGRHRILCGDSTNVENIEKVLNGHQVDMVLADPPYGISIVNDKQKVGADGLAKTKKYSKVAGDESTDAARDFYTACIGLDISNFIIWGGNYFLDFLPASSSWIIWDKRGGMASNNFADGEMAWCSFHTRVRIYKQIWNGMIREGESESRVHPTQKPIKLLADIIEDQVKGNLIFDGFLGSGSIMVAAHQLDRTCYGMELDPKYCQVIINRMMKLDADLTIKINGEEYINDVG